MSDDFLAVTAIMADDQARIPYRPCINAITGSVTATILLLQIIYWWSKKGRKPFFKFAGPCKHERYQRGDSWQEELGFTRYEFEGALHRIAAKITKGTSKREAWEQNFVVYWTDKNRVTWYEVNEGRVSAALLALYQSRCPVESSTNKSANVEKPHYISNAELQHYIANAKHQHQHVMVDSHIRSIQRSPEITNREETPATVAPDGAAPTPPVKGRKSHTKKTILAELSATGQAAIQHYRDVFGCYPNEVQMREIDGAVADLERWQKVCHEWAANGWNQRGVGKMLDRYRKNVTGVAHVNGRPATVEPRKLTRAEKIWFAMQKRERSSSDPIIDIIQRVEVRGGILPNDEEALRAAGMGAVS